MGEKIRLDKFIADLNIGTRSEVKTYLKKGLVKVNDLVIKDGGFKVDIDKDGVSYMGENLRYEKYHYYMLNKPEGVVSATRDGLSKTVLELLKDEPTKNLFPVGRLDKDTEGLLLITDDGPLGHELLSPKHHVDKTYYVEVDRKLLDSEIKEFCEGVDIGDEKKTLPAKLEHYNDNYLVTIHEGRYHQIKRMFEAFSSKVTYLKRLRMGSLTLDQSLEKGQYRKLTKEEIEKLKER